MQEKNKYVRNLTIGAVTGGLIAGGIQLALIEKKPFIRDYINTYGVTTDTTIRTTEGLNRLNPTLQFLTEDELESMNELEVKSYAQAGDDYDVDLYGFTIERGMLTEDQIDQIFEQEKKKLNITQKFHKANGYYETDEYEKGNELYFRGYCIQQLEEMSKQEIDIER